VANSKVYVKQGQAGISYVASIGDILYNDRIYSIGNQIIPIFEQSFFTLPGGKDKYSAVNVYYDVFSGKFVFDQLGIYDESIDFVKSRALSNVLPIAQFLLRQDLSSFIVLDFKIYSEMSTYAVSTSFIQGATGLQSTPGEHGITGYQGVAGSTGLSGSIGMTGLQGITGIGPEGYVGAQGETGGGYDYTYLLDIGFESNRFGAMDRSPYERDCVFFADDMGGTTGWVGATEPVTGIQDSNFVRTTGIIERAHEVTYAGGSSEYRHDSYLPFSGAISCWLKIKQRPRALFSYEANFLEVSFSDESRLFPSEWHWDFGDGLSSILRNPSHTYEQPGTYVVTLRVTNENGTSFRFEEITVEEES